MSDAIETAKLYIEEENYEEAFKLAKKRHGKDDVTSYLTIIDLLIEKDYLVALEEKGLYYQYYDETHDNGDYGEKYFDEYLEKQPRSINVICDKALSRFNKNKVDESLELMEKAEEKYKSYSPIEKPRISKKEVIMGKIELLIQAKRYDDALKNLDKYESQFGGDTKSDLYKGQMLQKNGKNNEALEYLERSLQNEDTIIGLNAKGDALYELHEYKDALKSYNDCINYEKQVEELELVTNFNYKAAFCCVKLGNDKEAIKYLNKTINLLNEHGRLPNDLEAIYQKCSFEKERIMKTGEVKDEEFRQTRFFSARTSIIILIIILILYVILKMIGY
ncbi:MAG: tetratricopeptide repeat protein [Methanobrevibacter sp.]|uniref:Tetratricopeptide repeat protein n=1 Tax=Methanobrevibacter millerae TaxID=230361 RepID=A0A8T3VR73_9EURY|nr:tetratricopeptide repeat protein [Methanobrevibacter sp.]MBE6510445.1 tetratricopeptide repeat protein [Methanobrevibacter millerae]MBO5152354.1 tetratricopeptide repeat protein [Methanobrevibacter sp.]